MNYKESGVDIESGNLFARRVKELAEATYNYDVISGVGGFCSLYKNPGNKNQLIAASTDGVGSKLLLSIKYRNQFPLSNIGLDLVAMSINDIITCGARPLFFLDYLAVPRIDGDIELLDIMTGIAKGCALSDCALIGGETAEMPAIYDTDKMDMAGYAVGIVEADNLCNQVRVLNGDVLIGISSSGPHSNGFSLINSIDFSRVDDKFIEWCLKPTWIYHHIVERVMHEYKSHIHAMAHITGGGLEDNIRRVIPKAMDIQVVWTSWNRPDGFSTIQSNLDIPEEEMKKVFNLGIGYVMIVKREWVGNIMSLISEYLECYQIGFVYKKVNVVDHSKAGQ